MSQNDLVLSHSAALAREEMRGGEKPHRQCRVSPEFACQINSGTRLRTTLKAADAARGSGGGGGGVGDAGDDEGGGGVNDGGRRWC